MRSSPAVWPANASVVPCSAASRRSTVRSSLAALVGDQPGVHRRGRDGPGAAVEHDAGAGVRQQQPGRRIPG